MRNLLENVLLRGQIAAVTVEDDQVVIDFDWLASNRGGVSQRFSHGWEKNGQTQLSIDRSTAIFKTVSGNIFVNDPTTCNLMVFIASGEKEIDPEVEGLL